MGYATGVNTSSKVYPADGRSSPSTAESADADPEVPRTPARGARPRSRSALTRVRRHPVAYRSPSAGERPRGAEPSGRDARGSSNDLPGALATENTSFGPF